MRTRFVKVGDDADGRPQPPDEDEFPEQGHQPAQEEPRRVGVPRRSPRGLGVLRSGWRHSNAA